MNQINYGEAHSVILSSLTCLKMEILSQIFGAVSMGQKIRISRLKYVLMYSCSFRNAYVSFL